MKRIVSALLLLLLLLPCASAEIVGRGNDEDYIHCYTAPNGQDIYYISREEEPPVRFEDVNFDGSEDIVITTIIGAQNFYYEFFIWQDGRYARAEHFGAEYGLCNYQLYPEQGIVLSNETNGFAGALHRRQLFKWNGAELTLIRQADSETLSTWTFEGSLYTTVTDNDRLQVRVADYPNGLGEGVTLWERELSLNEMTIEFLNQEESMLWQGLR